MVQQSGDQKETAANDPEIRVGDFDLLPEQLTRRFDRAARARVASLTGGMSPVAIAGAMLDWSMHLAMSPGRQLELLQSGVRKATRFGQYATRVLRDPDCEPATEPQAHDRRFNDPSWKKMPFNLLSQSFLLTREWCLEATHDVEGVTAQHEALVSFLAHEILDAVSPYNLPLTNPQVLGATASEKGANLARGVRNLVEDTRRNLSGELPVGTEDFVLGEITFSI
jgi:polyhydroxyalkanoate synthase